MLIDELEACVAHRLRIGDHPLPRHDTAWFAALWERVSTLSVDELEMTVQRSSNGRGGFAACRLCRRSSRPRPTTRST